MTVFYSYYDLGRLRIHEHEMLHVDAFDTFSELLRDDGTTVFFGVFHD